MDLRRLPIRQKLILLTMVTSVTALVVVSTAFLIWDYRRARADLARDLTTHSAVIAENSTAALSFADPATAGDVLHALAAKPEVLAAAVYDRRGEWFAGYVRPGTDVDVPEQAGADGVRFDHERVTVFGPVTLDGSRIGTVLVEATLAPLERRVQVGITTVALLALGAGLLALVLSLGLQQVISTPIQALALTAADVARRRDYSVRVVRQSDDELGVLVDSFNQMLAAIETRDQELLDAKEQLERRVVERTAALQRELTERRRAEQQLALRNEELSRSNRELDDFAYVASHDLKEPLRGIHNFSRFLQEDYGAQLDEDGRAKLATLQRLTHRMERLIEALLHYSRVGRVALTLRRTDLDEVIGEALESIDVRLKETAAEVRIAGPLPEVRCDRILVGEVFQNLIANAARYNDKTEKWIEIGAGAVPADAPEGVSGPVFYVRDNGIGIPERHREAVFRIFKRLHPRERFGGGVGAGLTIVRKIVERHHGAIWIRSTPGTGTTVYFTLGPGE